MDHVLLNHESNHNSSSNSKSPDPLPQTMMPFSCGFCSFAGQSLFSRSLPLSRLFLLLRLGSRLRSSSLKQCYDFKYVLLQNAYWSLIISSVAVLTGGASGEDCHEGSGLIDGINALIKESTDCFQAAFTCCFSVMWRHRKRSQTASTGQWICLCLALGFPSIQNCEK